MKAKPKPIVRAPDRTSRGHRVLHVNVPEDVFNAAKAQALLLGIDWPKFVVELLRHVDPRRIDSPPLKLESTPASS